MSDELIKDIAVVLAQTFLTVFFGFFVVAALNIPGRLRNRRYRRQLDRIQRVPVAYATADALDLDWMVYDQLPKSQIQAVLAANGWHYRGQTFTRRSWVLHFSRFPDPAMPSPWQLLHAELTESPYLQHRLDTTLYMNLDPHAIAQLIHETGWCEVKRFPEFPGLRLVLVRADQVARWNPLTMQVE